MRSRESHTIRASFRKDDNPSDDPTAGRHEWEAAAALVPLLVGIKLTVVEMAGVFGEWVDNPSAQQDQVIYFLHGGGYNAGSPITHRELASHLSLAAGMRVLLPAYRLAPEYPFPAALQDAGTGYQWLLTQGVRPEKIVLAGDSAGGGLALSTLLWIRQQKLPMPAAAVLLSPWVDLTLSGASMQTHETIDPVISRKALELAAGWYAGDTPRTDPLLSPLHADLAGLPPLLIQVGSDEILLSDSTRLAERAQTAGVKTTIEVWDGMWHAWHGATTSLPEASQAITRIGTFIQEIIGTTSMNHQ